MNKQDSQIISNFIKFFDSFPAEFQFQFFKSYFSTHTDTLQKIDDIALGTACQEAEANGDWLSDKETKDFVESLPDAI